MVDEVFTILILGLVTVLLQNVMNFGMVFKGYEFREILYSIS